MQACTHVASTQLRLAVLKCMNNYMCIQGVTKPVFGFGAMLAEMLFALIQSVNSSHMDGHS